mmetsp:Transcript_143541/g.253339  ORF Transcript_143541/g.253339 Transcript_143541/m.253339 type:complete len:101 (-) Transcript_143541:66-368(-)
MGHASECSEESIEFLFKVGVDDTIKLLESEELWVDKDKHGNGGLTIVRPKPGCFIEAEDCEHMVGTFTGYSDTADFWDCCAHKHDDEEDVEYSETGVGCF